MDAASSSNSLDPNATNVPEDATAARLDALLAKKKSGGGGGFFDTLKGLGGDVLGDAAKALSTVAAVPVSLGNQLGNVGAALLGRNQDDPNYRPSLGNFFGDIGKGLTAGQVIQRTHPNWSPWIKDAAGGALDLASNPLNALAPGTDALAKEGLVKAGQVIGDAAARDALKEGGVDAIRAAVEKELAGGAAEHGGAQTLEDVLSRGTQSDLGRKGTEQVVQDRLASLADARSGAVLKTPGFMPDIPVLGSSKVADLGSAALSSKPAQAVSDIFNPTSQIERELGQGAADATSQATHTASGAKMEARAAGATDGLEPAAAQSLMADTGHQAMADTLAKNAPEIAQVATSKAEVKALEDQGWKALSGTDTFVHPLVDKALTDAVSAPPGKAVAAWDSVMSTIKQLTVFNPLNAVQHDFKRATYNALGELSKNGLDIASHREAQTAYKAIEALASKDIPVTAENLVKDGMEAQAAKRAEAYAHSILADNPMFESDAAGKNGVWGTRTAAHIAEKNGSIARGSVFFHALDQGADASAAAQAARRGLMDFSNVGLTPFERDKAQRLAFFYKFPRRAIPAGIDFALEHPAQANVLSHVGLGVQQGARNQFGEHIGPALDTPLEASFSGLGSLVQNPLNYALGELNPALTAVIDSKKRGIGDVIAPIGMVQKHVENAADASGADRLSALAGMHSTSDMSSNGPLPGGIPLPGAVSGEDYATTKAVTKNDTGKSTFDANVAMKAKSGKNLTQKEALSLLADKAGVANPYGMNEASLLQALQGQGIDKTSLLNALKTKIPASSVR